MNLDELRQFCLALPSAEEALPFDEQTLVFRVRGKMFLLTNLYDYRSVNLKCDPDKAIELRERYLEVTPGWHMNKKHWNTVQIEGRVRREQLQEWIVDSYRLVVAGLSKKVQRELETL